MLIATLMCLLSTLALADSSGPRLAAYYDLNLAICDGQVYEWEDRDRPRAVMEGVRQVGVGRDSRYALTDEGRLLTWSDAGDTPKELMRDVHAFHAGRSGLLVIHDDGTLWSQPVQGLWGFGERLAKQPTRVATNVRSAAVGDSANYYVTEQGDLFVHGKAFRGQYGDGKLREADGYIRTAGDVIQVVAHTGHALILKRDGTVWGTGGNIYGPLGPIRWRFGEMGACGSGAETRGWIPDGSWMTCSPWPLRANRASRSARGNSGSGGPVTRLKR
jgi:hypothetical protein